MASFAGGSLTCRGRLSGHWRASRRCWWLGRIARPLTSTSSAQRKRPRLWWTPTKLSRLGCELLAHGRLPLRDLLSLPPQVHHLWIALRRTLLLLRLLQLLPRTLRLPRLILREPLAWRRAPGDLRGAAIGP